MLSKADRQRSLFCENDTVAFAYRGRIVEGQLMRMNPKRALVRIEAGDFMVPYELLLPRSGNPEEREARIEQVEALATRLIKEHGLKNWTFRFDQSSRRAGCCSYRNKLITIAFDLARTGSEEDIRDTILHEIAHALVGKKHNHDSVWKTKALEIGCTGERTHSLHFSQPRWSVTCENRCWTHTAQQRNSRLICRKCGSKLIYSPFTPPT